MIKRFKVYKDEMSPNFEENTNESYLSLWNLIFV